MRISMVRTILAVLVSISLMSCASEHRDFGQYRVEVATDHMGGLVCQPRQEFYFLPNAPSSTQATYLGTCGSPGFITDQMQMPGDPSCFAISTSGTSMVYYHRPELCGAGTHAKSKPGGIYQHSAAAGDHLLYPDTKFSQIWSADPVPKGAMRIMWTGKSPSRAGAKCAQNLVIYADGHEDAEERPDPTSPMCRPR